MIDLNCKTAREWLATYRDLAPLDARRLDRHVMACPGCWEVHRFNLEMDRAITGTLAARADRLSVRAEVRAKLLAHPETLKRRKRFAGNKWHDRSRTGQKSFLRRK